MAADALIGQFTIVSQVNILNDQATEPEKYIARFGILPEM
jgi:hypothetical protein